MNSPLRHCPRRPSPGILAALSIPLMLTPQYVNRVGPVEQCHSSFCLGIWLLSHVIHIGSKLGPITQLGLLRLAGVGEMSGVGLVVGSIQPVSGPSA